MSPKLEKVKVQRGLGALGGHLGTKNREIAVLSDFGQPRDAQNGPKMAQVGAKMVQKTLKIKKNDPKMNVFFERFLEAFWEGFWRQNGRQINPKTLPKTCWNRS